MTPMMMLTAASAGRFDGMFAPETRARLIETAVDWGVKALGALLVLIVGMWLAGRLKKLTRKAVMKAPNLDETLAGFFSSLVYYLIVAFVVIAVLSMFGIQTTGLAALIGAAGLAIGLALQGTLGHLASGVMLLAFRPFHVGDYINAGGEAGTVKEINLFTTILATPDNVQIIVPNGDIWSGAITNYSAYDTRRVDIVYGISYGSDIDKAMTLIRDEMEKDERTLSDPAPQIIVSNLNDSSVDITMRVWVKSGDYWPTKFALTKAVKERFDADGIDIPFPTRTVYQIPQQS
ncbi:mechanosensitive ion channel family protein [Parvularcula marina]|nr:mechanosensitive ion channel domain-containing protein [Parvularcula marina]